MIVAMDEAGVAQSALVHASTCYGYDNSLVADAVAAHPERFTGVFSVDMLAADAPERIRHWVGQKLTGMRLFTAGSTMVGQASWLDDPKSFPAWDCAVELGIPVCVQMRPAGMPQLQTLLARYPKATIIIDHFLSASTADGPPYAEARVLFDLAKHPNVYLKFTPVVVKNSREGQATPETFVARTIQEFGASRIAWGSNFPASGGSLKVLLDEAKTVLAGVSEADREWIFHKTAEGLYPALRAAK
jgi:predicted TIM-barrel fold metal-dependent hydrolase